MKKKSPSNAEIYNLILHVINEGDTRQRHLIDLITFLRAESRGQGIVDKEIIGRMEALDHKLDKLAHTSARRVKCNCHKHSIVEFPLPITIAQVGEL